MKHGISRLLPVVAVVALSLVTACAPAAAPSPTAAATAKPAAATTAPAASPAAATAASPVASAVAATSGTAAPAAAPLTGPAANLTFQLNWIPNIQHFGPVYADKMGFYKDANLTVKVQPGGQGIDGLQMVAAGAADIALSSAATIYTANEKGLNVVAFAAVYQKSASALVCRGDRGITKFSDLTGKTIGSKGPSDMETLPRLFAKNNIDYSTLKITPIGASSVTEIIGGLVDCQLAFAVNEPITLQKAGITPVVFNVADYAYGGQGEVYITRQDFLDKNPEVLARFLQATAKAWNYYLDDPARAANWIVESKIVDGLDLDQQKAQATAMASLVATDYTKANGLLALNPALWQEQAIQALDEKRITAPPNMEKAMSNKVLNLAMLMKR